MHKLSTTQLILVSFLTAIIIGAFLLMLPISSAEGQAMPFFEALFAATSCVSLTGFSLVDTYAHWSIFGQVVMLVLIQCGGLGIISITTGVMLLIGKKISLKDRLLLEASFNLSSMSGIVRFLKKVVKGTLLIEVLGAIAYMFVFVPQFGAKGIWISVFNSVSGFCNAGLDIIGNDSLLNYVGNVPVNVITMILVILGGVGYIVWWDFLRVFGLWRSDEIKFMQIWNRFTLHTKLVLISSVILIFFGGAVIFVTEYNNPQTLGVLSLGEKVLAALFQSVTCRTAGFFTIPQTGLYESTALFCMLLMFVGGSPVGTAGGVKTTTMAIVILAAFSLIKGSEETEGFGRSISMRNVRKALTVLLISIGVIFLAIMLVLGLQPELQLIDVAYEVISAVTTAGLSRDITCLLNETSKAIIIICMYLGRIGPISMALAIGQEKRKAITKYPEEEVTIG